jgi:hypothetical protein
MVLLLWLAQWLLHMRRDAIYGVPRGGQGDRKGRPYDTTKRLRGLQAGLLLLLLVSILVSVVHEDAYRSGMPLARGFHWPQVTAHAMLAQHFIAMVPPEASVSSQSKLVPHMSQRLNIYMFPYADTQADYILLDLRGDIYPYATRQAYQREVNRVLQSRNYRILAAQDGYLLLERALPHSLP